MLRRAATVAVVVALLAAACAPGKADKVVTVAGQPVVVETLVKAHAAMCEAAAQPARARALFFDRAHESLHTVARGLEDVDRAQAAQLLEAKEKVEAELDRPPPSLPVDLRRLAEVYRSGLGRLAIEAPPCVE